MSKALAVHGLLWAILILVAFFTINHYFTAKGHTGTTMSNNTELQLTSTAFTHTGLIPSRYTCDGDTTLHPPLTISGVPEEAKTLVLIVDDPDVPTALKPDGVFDHWIMFNIPSTTTEIPEGAYIGVSGSNGAGNEGYTGPCPPAEYEPSEHRYIFALYALDAELSLSSGATKDEVKQAMEGHIVGETQLIGRYKKK